MTDSCKICGTDAISLDEWYLKIKMVDDKIAIIECICNNCEDDFGKIRSIIEAWK